MVVESGKSRKSSSSSSSSSRSDSDSDSSNYETHRNIPLTDGYDTALVKIGAGIDLLTAYATFAGYGLILIVAIIIIAGGCEDVHCSYWW